MNVELAPDVEATVMAMVARGAYATPMEAVNTALRLFLDRAEVRRRHDELKSLIREGVEAADRGELLDGDEVFDELLRDLEKSEPRSE